MFICPLVGTQKIENGQRYVNILKYNKIVDATVSPISMVRYPITPTQISFETCMTTETIKTYLIEQIINDLYLIADTVEATKLNKDFYRSINIVADEIKRKSGRGRGNFIVVSNRVFYHLQLPNMSNYIKNEVSVWYGKLLEKVGTLNNGNIDVFVNHFTENDSSIVGYVGTSQFDTGYISVYKEPFILQNYNCDKNIVNYTDFVVPGDETSIGGGAYYGVIKIIDY